MNDVMITTIDNPYSPFTEFDAWKAFDESKGYHTCALLARVARVSDELSEEDETRTIREAIDTIVKENLLGIYKKVSA